MDKTTHVKKDYQPHEIQFRKSSVILTEGLVESNSEVDVLAVLIELSVKIAVPDDAEMGQQDIRKCKEQECTQRRNLPL